MTHGRSARRSPYRVALFLALLCAMYVLHGKQRSAAPATRGLVGLHVVGFGSQLGTVSRAYGTAQAVQSLEYSEDVTVNYNLPVDRPSFAAHLTIIPAAAYAIHYGYGDQGGQTPTLQIRKVPGVTYTLAVASGVRAQDGTVDPAAHAFQFTTPASPPDVTPLRATPGEPYRYGVLAHPYPGSLAGPTADQQIALMAGAGVRFVRIDYHGAQIEPGPGRFDFALEDAIMDKLAAHGITELPLVTQYSAPRWDTGGHGYPAIWASPAQFAAFAAAIAIHVAHKYPMITRMELFNEPNVRSWWAYSQPGSPLADPSGRAAAVYLRAAYAAIKHADPAMTVVGPALANGGISVDPRSFLSTMYAAGCRRGVCWDVLSVHNYAWNNPNAALGDSAQRFAVYQDLQAIAAAHGDPHAHVMLTEWGYSIANTAAGFAPQVQAYYLALGLNRLLADPTVDGVVYVNIYDAEPGFWGGTALTTPDFLPLPSYTVYRQFASYRGAPSTPIGQGR